jgi:hypothetical protein
VQQLLGGVRLWQVWQGDLPLASWREPLVQWVYSDARAWLPEQAEVVPSFRTEFCAMHRLWMTTPLSLQVPSTCYDTIDQAERFLSWRSIYEPPLSLAQVPLMTLEMALQPYPMSWSAHPAATVALATVMEYAAATYGPKRIGVLVAEVSEHESWATLIPAVFDVSAEEFEAGWQAYLAEQYGVKL